ncbi:ABC-2 type transport system ATP-binding protein [Nocardioides scoriae]|uniref:ABC-2 type transport system ATP-binding protein n=1 Tax=Nocardioides scoriae TaxID=642780 RepID=A0A1H1RH84_9ACTN|nr:ABC transporter ATP-binding protein [Nocardioides scoriae]SDS35013.1 ABC-2 type transport system ATP-binding protein [Nocardioides scoriae]
MTQHPSSTAPVERAAPPVAPRRDPGPRSDSAIRVRGLRRRYGSGADAFEAVRGVDLDVAAGSIHALLGVNGAGKTSTLEVVEGLAAPSGGEVSVLGLDPVRDRAAVRRRTGVLLQRSGFVGDLTVHETLQMWAATVTDPRPVEESLELLDLVDRAQVRMRALSGGEQRRVDLACTLTGRPEVVMLDEPTTGLDPESRRQVWRLVRELREQGSTVLLTTHYLDEAEALADQVSIMRAGEVVREGTVAEIVAAHPSQISFRTPSDPLPLPAGEVDHDGELTVLRVEDLQPALTELLLTARDAGVVLDRLAARTASLESVFLDLAAATDAATPEGATR